MASSGCRVSDRSYVSVKRKTSLDTLRGLRLSAETLGMKIDSLSGVEDSLWNVQSKMREDPTD